MNALLQSAYPVGFAVVSMCGIVVIVLAMMWLLTKNPVTAHIASPTIVISLFMLLTFITVTIFATLKEIPETKTGELLLGALISTFTVVITFWFARNLPKDRE